MTNLLPFSSIEDGGSILAEKAIFEMNWKIVNGNYF